MMKTNKEIIKLSNGWKLLIDHTSDDCGKYVFTFIRGSRQVGYMDTVVLKLTENDINSVYESIHPQTGINLLREIKTGAAIIDASVYISQIRRYTHDRKNSKERSEISNNGSLSAFNGVRDSVIMVSTDTMNALITMDMFQPGPMRLISIMEQILDINPNLRVAR